VWLSELDFLMMSAVTSVLCVPASTWGGGRGSRLTSVQTSVPFEHTKGIAGRDSPASIIFQF